MKRVVKRVVKRVSGGFGFVRKRMFGSVRVRVALVAGLAFAITLVAGSMLLLHTLESRLVGHIRAADETALTAQRTQLLVGGLTPPSLATGSDPLVGANTVAWRISGPGEDQIVAVASADGYDSTADPADIGGTIQGSSTHLDSTEAAAGTGVAEASGAPAAAGAAGAGGGVGTAMFDTLVDNPAGGYFVYKEAGISGDSARVLDVNPAQGPFLVSSLNLAPGLALTTASSLAEVDATLSTTRTILWYAVPLLVLLVMGSAWLLVGRALRPVHSLTARAASINAQSLHERVPVSDVGDEVSELATTINSMLSRIEIADLSSRRLVSDASHELRTPIAVMRTELEVARRNPDAEWTNVSTTLLGEVDRLQGLVDDLLLLARISERGAVAEPFSLLDTVRDVAARRRSTSVGVEMMTRDDEHDVEVIGDSSAVQRALDHVATNAARHAVEHVEVRLETDRDDGLVAVHIDDDGPGIAECDRERVLQRFERLDEARSRDAGGSGLGLAVASDVMTAHGGRVDIADSPLGGARVTLLMLPGTLAAASS